MIDYVHLSTIYPIPENTFISGLWREYTFKDGTLVLYHHKRGAWIRYYPQRGKWTISGKIITLLYDTQVCNVDDIYGNEIQEFVSEINAYLQKLVSVPMVDICEFQVSRIDYCFNIYTPYVGEYLDVMNEGFRQTNEGARVNYTEQKRLTGSAYIKTKADYKGNTRRNYVLNYYDKYNRLEYQRDRKVPICREDWQWATNILRLEIQCGFMFVKELYAKLHIGRTFGELLSFEAAYIAHEIIYKRVFKADASQDFYAYRAAKRLLKNATARKLLELSAEHHKINGIEHQYGRKLIQKAGIYPYAFIKKGAGVEALENPLRLIWRKIAALGAVEDRD